MVVCYTRQKFRLQEGFIGRRTKQSINSSINKYCLKQRISSHCVQQDIEDTRISLWYQVTNRYCNQLALRKNSRDCNTNPKCIIKNTLGTSIHLCCTDGAEVDALPKHAENITTLCIVPTSHFPVEVFGVYTCLVDHILPINQINCKEHIGLIKYILKERFSDWVNVKETKK